MEKAITYLKEKYGEYTEFYDYDEAYETYKNEFIVYKNRDEIYLLGCMLLLFCIGLFANNILRIRKKKKEFAIYYIYGLTWGESIILSYMRNAILVFVILLVIYLIVSLSTYFHCKKQDPITLQRQGEI